MKALNVALITAIFASSAQAADPCSQEALKSMSAQLDRDRYFAMNDGGQRNYLNKAIEKDKNLLITIDFYNSIAGIYKTPYDSATGVFLGNYRTRLNRSSLALKGFIGNEKAADSLKDVKNIGFNDQVQHTTGQVGNVTVIVGGGAVVVLGVAGFFTAGAAWAAIPGTLAISGTVGGATAMVNGTTEVSSLVSTSRIEKAYPVVFAGLESTRQLLEKEKLGLEGVEDRESGEADGARAIIDIEILRIKSLMKKVFTEVSDFRAMVAGFQQGDMRVIGKTIEPLIKQGVQTVADSYGVGTAFKAAKSVLDAISVTQEEINKLGRSSPLNGFYSKYDKHVLATIGFMPIGARYSESVVLKKINGVVSRKDLCLLAEYRALKGISNRSYVTTIKDLNSLGAKSEFLNWALDRKYYVESAYNELEDTRRELLGF